ncbi:PoNe immunity protein domain-containing protein [Pseudomonas fakonensis]|uniref:PoNe immunity protein domain-containing protein n=1 Tax=Pseudomonas fakonensis TaxID=2842355 RepID=UPI001CECE6F4|nr:PoNe immunity protein domain-containing protein [Pseudomonas fakonensis]
MIMGDLVKRRQQFVTSGYYENMRAFYDGADRFWADATLDEDYPGQGAALKASELKGACFKALVLRYTAGEPVSEMEPVLEQLIARYESLQRLLAVAEGHEHISPLSIDYHLGHYEEFVQVVSLCILLHRADLLARLVAMTDRAGFIGEDALYEELLVKVLPGRFDVERWYHPMYAPLIDAIDAETPAQAVSFLDRYCQCWYANFEGASTYWHDTHLNIQGDEGSYVGYWAFEAGAVAYLHNLDDSAIDHMVYPKDLVEYARAQRRAG